MKYHVYAKVVGTKYIGDYEADSEEQAEEMAGKDAYVSLCHQCSSECESPEIDGFVIEEA